MANVLFSSELFDFNGVQDVYDPNLQGYGKEGGVLMNKAGKQTDDVFGFADWEEIDHLSPDYYSLDQENTQQTGIHQLTKDQEQEQFFSDFTMMDDFQFNMGFPPIQSAQQDSAMLQSVQTEIVDFTEHKKEINPNPSPVPVPLTSFELLNNYTKGLNRLKREKQNESFSETTHNTVNNGRSLSTEEVMRVAGAWYIQFSTLRDDDLNVHRHRFSCLSSSLTDEENQDIELAHLLLASTELVRNQQSDRARRLLTQCDYLSSSTGSPVQRIVYQFAEALRERIDRETGRISFKDLEEKGHHQIDIEEAMMAPNPALLFCHQMLPFSKVLQFAGMQALIENVGSATKVHFIDLGVRTGMQWTVLMQDFASRHKDRIEFLKITAVGTISREKIDETGNRLVNFAKALNLPFEFKVVLVSDMNDLKLELFEIEADEAIAIYCPLLLRTMIVKPDMIESLMRVIKNLNPCVMVVTEVEGNHNSPCFIDRFIEVLFYYSAFFDCFEACADRSNQDRITIERIYCSQAIRNIVAAEGAERTFRHVGIDVWRMFFARFGLVETELSESSLYQANLILKQLSSWSSCTLDMNGKSLIVGWKGTPMHSVSAWKFH